MPPDPVPVVRLRADVVVVVLRCFRLLPPAAPPAARGADNLLGERVPLPTDVELAGAGYKGNKILYKTKTKRWPT